MADDSVPDLSRPQMFLFGCTLKADRRVFRVEAEEDDAEHQLSLKTVCLGAEAEDVFHTVEVEGVAYDGKTTRVPLAVLRPSVLPSMSLGGFEITPPVTFRLQSGCGPLYLSGQHFVSVKDSEEEEEEEDEEEENNSSPVKRPSTLASGKQLPPKKLKLESDEDEDEDEDDGDEEDEDEEDDDDDEDDSDEDVKKSAAPKPVKKSPEVKKVTFVVKQNGSPGKPGPSAAQPHTKGRAAGRSGAALTVPEIRSRLASHANQGKPFPKTEQKFENFAKSSFNISDKTVVKSLWTFIQTLKTGQK